MRTAATRVHGPTHTAPEGDGTTAWDAAPADYRHWCHAVAHGADVADLTRGAEVLARSGDIDTARLHRALVHQAQARFTTEYEWGGYGPGADSWWSLVPVALRYAKFPLVCLMWLAVGVTLLGVR